MVATERLVGRKYERASRNETRLWLVRFPAPGISKGQLRQQVQRRGGIAAIVRGNPHQHIIDSRLSVFDEHVEISILIEYPGVEQFVFRGIDSVLSILGAELRIGISRLRILVKHFQVRMRGGCIQVVVELFDVLTVIAFTVGQTEQTLFENGITLVPQSQGEAERLLIVRKPRNAVLAPPISSAAGMIVRKIFPSVSMRTVVFTNRAPLAYT